MICKEKNPRNRKENERKWKSFQGLRTFVKAYETFIVPTLSHPINIETLQKKNFFVSFVINMKYLIDIFYD